VVAFNVSGEMVRLARALVGDGAAVHHMRFGDVAWLGEFDGIWACASLLHVPSASFPDVALQLAGALRPGGAWYMSFKMGDGERRAEGGSSWTTRRRRCASPYPPFLSKSLRRGSRSTCGRRARLSDG